MENDSEGPTYSQDRLATAMAAFGKTDLSDKEHYVLHLTARLFEAELMYEQYMERLSDACVRLYGEQEGKEIYQRLLNT